MKIKKIFLTLVCVIALLFAMAIFVGATEFTADFGEVTIVDGISERDNLDTSSRVVLKDADGNYTTYPSYYILNLKGDKALNDGDLTFTELNEKTGKSYDGSSIILFELPEGIETVTSYTFARPNGQDGYPVTNVEKIVLPDTMTAIVSDSFRSASLKSITLGTGIKSIGSWSFPNNNTQLEEVIIPKGSQLETIGASAFRSCSKLQSINFENATELTSITDGYCFYSTAIKVFDFSHTKLTTISGSNHLQNNTAVETVIFPTTFTNLTQGDFFGNCATIKTVVFLGKMETVNINWYGNQRTDSDGATFYFAQNSSTDYTNRKDNNSNPIKSVAGYVVDGRLVWKVGDEGLIERTDTTGTLNITIPHPTQNTKESYNGYYYIRAGYKEPLLKFVFCVDHKAEQLLNTNALESNQWRYYYASYDLTDTNLADKELMYSNDASKTIVFSEHVKIDSYYDEVPATCTEKPKHNFYCQMCDINKAERKLLDTVYVEGDYAEHDYAFSKIVTEATCTDAAIAEYKCKNCTATKTESYGSALGHDFAGGSVTAIIYEDFTLNGTKTIKCSRCDVTEDSSLAPIFTVLGYSKSETDGVIGLKAGYAVDFDALKVYEDFNNVTVEYGMKLANAKYASEISNDASENVFNVDLTESDYNRFNTTIVGFKDTDTHKNLSLIMLAYAKCDGKVQYIQAETSSGEVDGFKTITIATVEASLVEAQPVVATKED